MGLQIKYNEGQLKAIEMAECWYYDRQVNLNAPQVFEITGPAGSGKTTIIYGLVERLGLDIKKDVLFLALVGQAAFVMRTKGLNARTIHSALLYAHEKGLKDEKGFYIINEDGRNETVTEWNLKGERELEPIKNMKLVVVDEGSMVTGDLKQKILSLRLPVIVLGDLDQLPPVSGNSAFLQEPDVHLTKVERQSGESPILKLADMARNREDIPVGVYGENGEAVVIHQDELTDEMLTSADIIICGTNRMRNIINDKVRKIYGFTGVLPNKGEKIVFRKNHWEVTTTEDIPVTNGLQVIVENTFYKEFVGERYANLFVIDAIPHVPGAIAPFRQIKLDKMFFLQGCKTDKMKYVSRFATGEKAEFGYAITCHMAQGSQYKRVLIIEEPFNYQLHHKWLYTAITRAEKEVILVKAGNKIKFPMMRKKYTFD